MAIKHEHAPSPRADAHMNHDCAHIATQTPDAGAHRQTGCMHLGSHLFENLGLEF